MEEKTSPSLLGSSHVTNTANNVSSEKERVYPEGGWGWIVVAGAFVLTLAAQITTQSFGIMFSTMFTTLNAAPSTISWIFSMERIIWSLSQLFAPPLSDVFGWRKVGMSGAILGGVAISMSAYAPTVEFMFFSYSFLLGFALGLTRTVPSLIVPHYFKKRRGKAMAILSLGACFGQFLGPLLISYLQIMYGYRGGTLIMGAIFLQSVVGASTFRPVSRHLRKNSTKDKYIENCRMEKTEQSEYTETNIHKTENTQTREVTAVDFSEENAEAKDPFVNEATNKLVNRRFVTNNNNNSISDVSQNDSRKCCTTLRIIVCQIMHSIYSSLKMSRSCRALIIASGTAFSLTGFFNYTMLISFYLLNKGFSLKQASWGLSLIGICNTVAKIFIILFSDCKGVNKKLWYMTGTLILGLATFTIPWLSNYNLILASICLYGFGLGTNMCLYPVVMVELMGLKDYPPTFGFTGLFLAAGFASVGPFSGWLWDITGSPRISMFFLSGLILMCFLLWLLIPLATALDKKRGLISRPDVV